MFEFDEIEITNETRRPSSFRPKTIEPSLGAEVATHSLAFKITDVAVAISPSGLPQNTHLSGTCPYYTGEHRVGLTDIDYGAIAIKKRTKKSHIQTSRSSLLRNSRAVISHSFEDIYPNNGFISHQTIEIPFRLLF